MKSWTLAGTLFSLLCLSSCKQDISKVVEAKISEFTEPVSLTVSPSPAMGEVLVATEPRTITITIRNNSADDITKLSLGIDPSQSLIKFKEDSEGYVNPPGFGGTCSTMLAPNQTCQYILSFNPVKSGEFTIPVTFAYTNRVEAQAKTVTFTVLTGEPASLVFTNDVYIYNEPVIERTENVTKSITLNVKNAGGLNARNITYDFRNTIANGAFSLDENTCPTKIAPGKECVLKLSYTPKNNGASDPNITYRALLASEYLKDPNDNHGYLNGTFNVISATIQANFKANISALDFGSILGGNKLNRQIKLTNIGYREGVLQKLILRSPNNNSTAICTKPTSGKILKCTDTNNNALELGQFPFIFEDTDSCLGAEIKGIQGEIAGGSCIFKITYWPSKNWTIAARNTTNNFLGSKLDIVYDSRWKGSETIITKSNFVSIDANYTVPAKLNIEKIKIGEKEILLSQMTVDSLSHVTSDLGRIALVRSDTALPLEITLINEGEYAANIKTATDGSARAISETPGDLNLYYKNATLCNISASVGPNVRCVLSFNLNPREQSDTGTKTKLELQNELMFDDLISKFKKFIFSYDSGALYEDDGSAALNKELVVQLKALLVGKAVLSYTSINPMIVEEQLSGKSLTKFIDIKNVGTNSASAIIEHSTKNFTQSSTASWPFKIIAAGTLPTGTIAGGLPAYVDCKDILYPKGSTVTVYNSSRILEAGQTCRLAVSVEQQKTYKIQNNERNSGNNYKRAFFLNNLGNNASGTEDIWERKEYTQAPVSIAFIYYDGDTDDTTANNFLSNFGVQNNTADLKIGASFAAPPFIVLDYPAPITSAVLNRPRISYPAIAGNTPLAAYLTDHNSGGDTSDSTSKENYFYSNYFTSTTNNFAKSSVAVPQIMTLGIHGNAFPDEYKMHIGTFPIKAGQTYTSSYYFRNFGKYSTSTETLAVFSQDSATSYTNNRTTPSFETTTAPNAINLLTFNGGAITLPKNNIIINSSTGYPVQFSFSPTVAGLYKRCFNLTYNDRITDKTLKTCIYAEAVSSFPELKVDYWDASVTSSGGTISETFPGTPTATLTVENGLLTINKTSSNNLIFNAVKGSDIYAKKRIRITNIGNSATSTLETMYLSTGSDADATTNSDVSKTNVTGSPICGTSLAVNGYCEFDIKYKPTTTSLSSSLRYAMLYTTANKQYVSQLAPIQFNAIDAAKISVVGGNKLAGGDWSDPTAPKAYSDDSLHYSVDLGSYTSATHYVLSSLSPTKVMTYYLNNATARKASFLKMNPSATTSGWSTLYEKAGEVKIEGNPGCFYGTDSSSNPLAGFTGNTTCQIQITFSGYKTYTACKIATKTKTEKIGGNIDTSCDPYVYKLSYWSNDRDTASDIYIAIKGFIEPNQVSGDSISNVSAYSTSTSTGSIKLTAPTLSGTPGWGGVTSYILYYSTAPDDLKTDKIFNSPSTILSQESSGSFELANLDVNRYYYLKLVAKRNKNGIDYLSASTLPIITIPVPGPSYYYDHSLRALIDKNIDVSSAPKTLSSSVSYCSSKNYAVYLKGSTQLTIAKKLITSSIWQNILSNASNSEYGGIPVKSISHWLNDATVNLAGTLYTIDGVATTFPSYNTSIQDRTHPTVNLAYAKSCGNVSCDNAYRIVGGDGEELPYMGVFYTDNQNFSAYPRCFAYVICPTNTSKIITDPTCANP